MTKRFNNTVRSLCTLMLIMLMCACSSDDSVRQLLSNIPTDSQTCIVVRAEKIAEKAGLDKSEKGELLSNAKLMTGMSAKERDFMQKIATGDAGIDLETIIVFQTNGNSFVTGKIADTKKFRAEIAKLLNRNVNDFKSDGDVESLGNIAIANDKFWVSDSPVKASDIQRLVDLKEKESMASTAVGERLVGCTDIGIAVSSDNIVNATGSPEMRMLMAYIFDDPHTSFADIKFDNGLVDVSFSLLNTKGEDTKISLPMDKIDVGVFQRMSNTSSMVTAMSLPSKMMKKIIPLASQLGNSMPMVPGMSELLTSIDGTVAVSTSARLPNGASSSNAPISLAITLKGKTASQAANALTAIIKATGNLGVSTSFTDNVFVANSGTTAGTSALASHYNEIDGASIGILLNMQAMDNIPAGVFDYMAARIDAGGAAKGTLKIYMSARNRNSLASLIEAFSK